jgi:rSAM/selenodomain-associated transferase 1
MQHDAVIVFLRAPQKGRVKTRLARDLDPGLVLDLYRAFVLDTLASAAEAGHPMIFFTPDGQRDKIRQWLGDGYDLFAQTGRDIGERMAGAFQTVFCRGVKKALLVGTDIPQLETRMITQGFELLNRYDAVLGPSTDGGYYLAGFCRDRFTSAVFKGMKWSTPTVFDQAAALLKNNGLSYGCLPALTDIDTLDDFNSLITLWETGAHVGMRTSAILKHLTDGDIWNKDITR